MSAQKQADWDWVDQHFRPTLNDLMPIKRAGGLYVAYRSVRDLYTGVLEYSFIIGYERNEKGYGLQRYLGAHVRTADSVSIYDQIMRMHRAHPEEPFDDIRPKIKIKAWNFSEEKCPSIRTQVNKLQRLSFPLPSIESNVITLHPLNHEFQVQAGMGDMTFALIDEDHPMVKWALETKRALETCTLPNEK